MQSRRILIYGKKGCSKCEVLKKRFLKRIREKELLYTDIATEEGIVKFCKAERLNPQRIPIALVVVSKPGREFVPLEEDISDKFPDSALHGFCGVETDYDHAGLITNEMIDLLVSKLIV